MILDLFHFINNLIDKAYSVYIKKKRTKFRLKTD